MNITPENVLEVEHQAWLKHPVTVQLVNNLNKLKTEWVKSISILANDKDDLPIRSAAISIRQIDAIINLTTSTTYFVQQSKK